MKLKYLSKTFISVFLLLCLSISGRVDAAPINAVADLSQPNKRCANGKWGKNKCIDGYEINTPPVISLIGSSTINYTVGDTYIEDGASCTDTEDGVITDNVSTPVFTPTLNMNAAGTYTATYTCTDSGGLTDTVTRTVYVNSSGADIAFINASSVIDASPHIDQAFGAVMPDVNGDGCLDLYIGAHYDSVDSNMLIQDNVGGVCQGTFTYFPDNDNYSQALPNTPRITSRYLFGNFYDHPLGMWSFMGADVDGSASARYVLDPTFTEIGGLPQYLPKSTGCFGVKPKCVPLDIDGDGNLEQVSRLYSDPYNTGFVVDINTGSTIYTPTSNTNTFTQGLMVFDVDNDSYPEIVQMEQGGYFKFDPNTSTLNWVGGKIQNNLPNGADRHAVILDYDLDGDMDMVQIEVAYNTSDPVGGIPHLWSNNGDGSFTDVTSTAFASMPTLSILTGASSYANSQVADLDLDGYPDIIFMLENYSNALTIIRNNGNGTFTKTNSIGVDPTPGNFGANSDRPYFDVGDFDNDGRIDIVHNGDNNEGAVAQGVLLKNATNTTNNWMRLRVRGLGANTDGFHTRLSFFEPGTTNLVSYYHTGIFSGSHDQLISNVGLGTNNFVDIRAEFPHGGPVCNFSNVAANQDYIIFRSCNIQTYTPGSTIPLTYVASNIDNTVMTLVAGTTITTDTITYEHPLSIESRWINTDHRLSRLVGPQYHSNTIRIWRRILRGDV